MQDDSGATLEERRRLCTLWDLLDFLRWMMFVPGAYAAAKLAMGVVARLCLMASDSKERAALNLVWVGLLGGVVFVFVGAWIAPSKSRLIPAVVLSVFGVIGAAAGWYVEDWASNPELLLRHIAFAAAAIIAGIAACRQVAE